MLLTLHISKIETGNYRVLVLDGREEVDQWEAPNIATAIRDCGQDGTPGLLGFHIWYGNVCVGTTAMSCMRSDSEVIAQRLLDLYPLFFDERA